MTDKPAQTTQTPTPPLEVYTSAVTIMPTTIEWLVRKENEAEIERRREMTWWPA